jgi:anti-sigma regulatory factor (Ser/Thr protein kinase)
MKKILVESEEPTTLEELNSYYNRKEKMIRRHSKVMTDGMESLQTLAKSVKNASRDYYIQKNTIFDGIDIIHEIINSYQQIEDFMDEDKAVHIVLENNIPEMKLYGMVERFEDAITNLLTNAIRFSKECKTGQKPSVKVVISSFSDLETKVDFVGTETIDYFKIEVIDNGPGIPASIGERVFEMGITTKTISDGAGIGLAMARRDITLFTGRLSFDCTRGESNETTFKVVIPKPDLSHIKEEDVLKLKFKIDIMADVLILDHIKDDVNNLKVNFGKKSITCLTAFTSKAAMRYVNVFRPSVIILNPVLGINKLGIDFLRTLVKEKKYNDPKLFIITNLSQDASVVKDLKNEFGGTVIERNNSDYLVRSVEQYLKMKEDGNS